MARTYAGILGPLAMLTTLAHGVLHGGAAEFTLESALVALWVFAAVGYLAGRIAAAILEDALRARMAPPPSAQRPPTQ